MDSQYRLQWPRETPWWEDVADGTALVMDRGRLMYALRDADPRRWPEWSSLVQFVESEIAGVRVAGFFSPDPTVSLAPTRAKK